MRVLIYIGFELDPKHFEVAERRINDAYLREGWR